MADQQLKLYRPFEDKISRVTSIHGVFDRLQQNLWGEPHQKSVKVIVFHSKTDAPSNKIYFLASDEEVHLEVHQNPALHNRLDDLIQEAQKSRTFSRYSLARFVIDHGFEIHY